MKNTIIEYLERTIELFSDKISVVDSTGEITFKDLKSHALNIAQNIELSIINSPIAVFLPKSIQAVEAILGVLYSGNFYVPIDVKSPSERILLIFKNLNPRVVLTNTEYANILSNQLTDDSIQIINIDELTCGISLDLVYEKLGKIIDCDPIYCIYTSGSTGVPKGVLIPHRGVIDYINWAVNTYRFDENTIIGNQAPFHFDNSTLDIYLMIFSGSTLVIIPEMNFMFPYNLIEYLNQKKINMIFWVPSIMNNILKTNVFKEIIPKYLEKILFAGEVMPVKTLNYWRGFIGDALYSNLYGPTEITVDCTYYIVNRSFKEDESLPIGFPCKNSNILILNELNQLVKRGELGELCVRGSSLALGYWNDLEKTSQAFCQNPLQNFYPERIYRTGDLVKYNDLNEIIYIGRKDSQIKHMGYRIELGEIENVVLGIEGLNNSCVLYDFENQMIVLFIEDRSNVMNDNKIRKFLIQKLPKYMIPSKIIKLVDFPLNSNGKVDRLILKKKFIETI